MTTPPSIGYVARTDTLELYVHECRQSSRIKVLCNGEQTPDSRVSFCTQIHLFTAGVTSTDVATLRSAHLVSAVILIGRFFPTTV